MNRAARPPVPTGSYPRVTEANTYRTFWRRFWVSILDSLLFGIAAAILFVLLTTVPADQSVVRIVLATVYLAAFGTAPDNGGPTQRARSIARFRGLAFAAWWVAERVTMLFNRKRRAVQDFIADPVVLRVD